jgi:putative Holliday junction resolvase
MRILALDVGGKRIGLAISDALGITAQGLDTLIRENINNDLDHIKKIVRDMNISELVVGLPLNMNGSPGPKAKEIYDFVGKLKEKIKIPVTFWDERLSTLEANRILLQADMSRRKRKRLDDKIAAQLILQGYLDSIDKKTQ